MTDEHSAAVAWMFGTEPTDRALRGWQPRVWIALGNGVMPAKEWQPVLRYAPCRYGIAWWHKATGADIDPAFETE